MSLTFGENWVVAESLEDKSIEELEFRIQLLNFVLKWLRSGDELLRRPDLSPHVPDAIERYTSQLHDCVEVCRRKKIERGDTNNDNSPKAVGLNTAKITGKSGL